MKRSTINSIIITQKHISHQSLSNNNKQIRKSETTRKVESKHSNLVNQQGWPSYHLGHDGHSPLGVLPVIVYGLRKLCSSWGVGGRSVTRLMPVITDDLASSSSMQWLLVHHASDARHRYINSFFVFSPLFHFQTLIFESHTAPHA